MTGMNLMYGVSICAFIFYLFLLLSFFNAPSTKQLEWFRGFLVACLFCTAGSAFMYLDVLPGYWFWYQLKFLGLILLPVCVYFFLFYLLEIENVRILWIDMVLTWVVALLNGTSALIVPTPDRTVHESGQITFHYDISASVYIYSLMQIAMSVYVLWNVYHKVKNDPAQQKKIAPILAGIALSFLVSGLMILDNGFPWDIWGGIFMAACMVYVVFQQYLFEFSHRIKIGTIYSIALIAIFLFIALLAMDVAEHKDAIWDQMGENVFAMLILTVGWTMLVSVVARKAANRTMRKRVREQNERIQKFQQETISLFHEEELYEKVTKVLTSVFEGAGVSIFYQKGMATGFMLVKSTEKKISTNEELQEQIITEFEACDQQNNRKFAVIKCDEKVKGFIYLNLPEQEKMNYIQLDNFHRIAAITSICMKNISTYQKVYQISIHDELTGLYNRKYYKDYMERKWNPENEQTIIYLDIDDFKLFNELYGEDVGDEILKWCGKLIVTCVRKDGATFRLGSNEYLVYMQTGDKEKIYGLVNRIRKRLKEPDEERPKVLQPINLSIGISTYPGSARDADELLKQAERALFYAKRNGKNRIEFYDKEIEEKQDMTLQGGYEQVAPTIYALTAAIDAKDSYTFKHSMQVSEYAVQLAKAVGLKSEEVQIVKEAGLLHDIGKIGIPEHILMKKGKLTNEEYEIMKQHVTNSIEMIHFLPNMNYVIPAVISHHERFDGKGYPRGLEGEDIPYLGRILAICDSFDAMISKRAYKEALSVEYAVEELERNKGTQFDPKLADTFIQLIWEGKLSATTG